MAVKEEIEHSANPAGAALVLGRLEETRPGAADRLAGDPELCQALVTVAAASPWLARICVTDDAALDVLAGLDRADSSDLTARVGRVDIARIKRLELLRVAARDLLGFDDLEQVGRNLSHLAARVLQLAYEATVRTSGGIAVIGMGKLGACELNYSSDVDVILVGPSIGAEPVRGLDVRPFLALARTAWRVDLDLRPEGRAGPLARSLPSYRAYWDRWAATWEFQALLKARMVSGDAALGRRFEEEAAGRVWSRPFGAEELRQVRELKARAEEQVSRRGLKERELKRGRGGIRDIEFAVQLLQLVHGRADSQLRVPSTLGALRALAAGGYIASGDASALEHAYRFLREVEHRLQLQEDQQVHTVPTGRNARTQLARVLGYRDRPAGTALAQFDADLRRHQATVRAIHERLFFRPLLETFTTAGASGPPVTLTPDAVAERLEAFGFADAERTHQAVRELTRGFSRTSQLMQQSLPVLLDWLSHSPNPDLGLLGLRTLAGERHTSEQLAAVCRESPEAARQLCQLLGTGPRFARDIQRHPDALTSLASNEFLVARTRFGLDERAEGSLGWRSGAGALEQGLLLFTRGESLRIASRDVLGLDDVDATGGALTDLAEAVIAVALRQVDPQLPFLVVGMGRLGGQEMAYSSDLDLMFVYETPEDLPAADAAAEAEAVAVSLVRTLGGVTPATGVYRVDTALRPEGRQGPQARSLEAFASYYQRWAQVWERQALLRGRLIAGDENLGRRFEDLAQEFVWDRPFGSDDIRDIRRTKARIERERVPPSEDPTFHLKLGPGSLSDIEWTAQLLQLTHGVRATGTIDAIEALTAAGALDERDATILVGSYRFCERTRNRLQLVRDIPGDSLPSTGPALTTLARSLGTTVPQLRDDYRRVTRRARRVVERLFYGTPPLTE
jgi:[glutamine synthetase] adenylyltransferase / [glutamine synthetase]-adenylyl-L-tyrosine phosphorylase